MDRPPTGRRHASRVDDDHLLIQERDSPSNRTGPAGALLTTHLAQRLEPISGVKPRRDAVCVYVDVLTVLNATTGQTFSQSTVTTG